MRGRSGPGSGAAAHRPLRGGEGRDV